MSNDLESRFIINDDDKISHLGGFEIPADWWSRGFEYCWAAKFLNKDDTILDAGCGIEHPFKDHASVKVKKVYAVDKDERIKDLDNSNIDYICSEFNDLDQHIKPNSIDKIYCISVLEHMPIMPVINALKMFKKLLKTDGLIILTLDYPLLHTDTFFNIVNDAGLMFYGSVDYTIGNDVIQGSYGNLKCYRAVLCNPVETQEIKPSETKPRKPKEIK